MAAGIVVRGTFAGLVVGISAFLYINFHHLLSISELRKNHSLLLDFVDVNPTLAPLCYIGILITVIGLTCPGATMLSFVGGIFFKQPYASVYAYIGYIIGATISYFVTRFILGDYMRRKLARNSSLYQKFEGNIRRNAFMYLVIARYTMVFPFCFVNGAAALVGVNVLTFLAASSLSCIPGALIYTTAGGALANLLHKMDDEASLDKNALISMATQDPNVRMCLVGLGVVFSVLLVVKFFKLDGTETDRSVEEITNKEK